MTGFIHEGYKEEHMASVYGVEVINGLHLGPRALRCVALTFNPDGLGPLAYYWTGIKRDTPTGECDRGTYLDDAVHGFEGR